MLIDNDTLKGIVKKSPLLAKTPGDLYHYACHTLQGKSGTTHKYLSQDEEQSSGNYKEFTYRINDIGFRDAYPDSSEQDIIAFFGCSCTFGVGLASEDLFSTLVANELCRPAINLGIGGVGFHRIALTFSAAARVWNIKTAVITLPNYSRFHYVNKDNAMASVILSWPALTEETERIRTFLVNDFSDQYFMSMAKDDLAWIISTAREHNIELILGSWEPDTTTLIRSILDCPADYVVSWHLGNDYARDTKHPGTETNKIYAGQIIQQIHKQKYI
jgi:hypothetical protein